ncbi:MAG: tRNA (adenine(22)-N(1))-methyltransferase [Anaerovoracaceae bacterium]
MRLSRRIYALFECVSKGESAADIGTDHGYVPMLLVKNGISPRVIMGDISPDSLSKAVATFKEAGLEVSDDDFRVCNGLDGINLAEVDDVIIAGLGGHTIVSILDSDPGKTKSFKKLILQPRKHSGNLRHYLYVNGYEILKEILVPEGKFMCEIIVAAPSAAESRESLLPEDSIEWKYPRAYENLPYEYVSQRVGWKIKSIDEEIENLKGSKHNRSELIGRLQLEREYLSSILDKNLNNTRKGQEK